MFARCARSVRLSGPPLSRSIYKNVFRPRLAASEKSSTTPIGLAFTAAALAATYFTLYNESVDSRAAMNSPDPENYLPPGKRLGYTDKSQAAEDEKAEAGDAEAQQGAFNPVTGEINWDCPCLGGMADGPCGPEFREAFSCFIFSEDEPKGINCVEKFKGMQNCFREHPDVYADEIANDDEADEEAAAAVDAASGDSSQATPTKADDAPDATSENETSPVQTDASPKGEEPAEQKETTD